MAIYETLPVYKEVYALILLIYEITKEFPREYKYTLGQDMKRDGMQLVRSIYRANKYQMESVITGGIINSGMQSPEQWLKVLRGVLSSNFGKEPEDWEIYHGDSFQLIVVPWEALSTAFIIKAAMKQCRGMEVRMAIGIGEASNRVRKITKSNGSAFIQSGECFDELGKATLAIRAPWEKFDRTINTMLELATLTMDRWKPSSSEMIRACLENPEMTQVEIGKLLDKPQSNISVGLKRGGFEEIQGLLVYYRDEIPIER